MAYVYDALCAMGFIISLTCVSSPQARPVSYPGGWTLMLNNEGGRNTAHAHYSPTAKTSIGYTFEYWRDKEFSLHAGKVNHLLKRLNGKDYQANLYLKSGLGIAHSDAGRLDSETTLAGFTGVAVDWENRRFFTSYENRYTEAGDIAGFFQQSARIGVAPYIGDYGDWHTWIMLQAEHMPEGDEHITVTPLMRVFKGVHLFEAGVSTRGNALLNYVWRY